MGKYTKAWKERQPEKPKRPLAPFANFISNYNTTRKHEKGRQLFINAACAWKKLDDIEKENYKDHEEVAKFHQLMKSYKRTLAAMKQPPKSFGLFIKMYWQRKKPAYNGTRRRFGEIQKEISVQWKRLSEEEKGIYKASAQLLKSLFETEQMTVLKGSRGLNQNWQNDGMEKVYGMLRKKMPAHDDDEEDEEMHEETLKQAEQVNPVEDDYDDFDDFEEDDEYI